MRGCNNCVYPQCLVAGKTQWTEQNLRRLVPLLINFIGKLQKIICGMRLWKSQVPQKPRVIERSSQLHPASNPSRRWHSPAHMKKAQSTLGLQEDKAHPGAEKTQGSQCWGHAKVGRSLQMAREFSAGNQNSVSFGVK